MSGLASPPWTLGTFPRFSSPSKSSSSSSYSNISKLSTHKSCRWASPPPPPPPPPYNCCSVDCRSQFSAANDLKFVLHDALDSSDVNTTHVRAAREGFCSRIKKLSEVERGTSISINREVDLGETALFIAAEDDSLISHSSVPLPVEAFIERLDDLSMDYCSHYSSSFRSSPENFLKCLERYLYFDKGFRRHNSRSQLEQRALYLHSVLTHRLGSASMLSLIYSEILKMIRLWGLISFDVEIFFPHDSYSSPRGYLKQKSKESDQLHIMTSQSLLVKILRDLKDAFWPFQRDRTRSLFSRAAEAANYSDRSNDVNESGLELASAKAARHRLERGVWTSVRFGDMRRALAACERLIILDADSKELRDYGALLYHCGFYEESLHYLRLYQNTEKFSFDSSSVTEEDDAVEKLIIRLNLIMTEEGWNRPPPGRKYLHNSSEPW